MRTLARVLICVLALVVGGAVAAPAVSALPVGAAAPDTAAMVAPAAGTVVSVTPSRIADSRTGLQIQGVVPAHGTAVVRVAGQGGIPTSGAAAVIATVTVVSPQRGGHVTVWPSGSAMPGTSNLNFTAGQTVANTVVVGLGSDGRIALLNASSGTAQLIVDVTGFVRSGTPTAAGAVVALPPARIVDSRIGQQVQGPVPAMATEDMQIGGQGGIPLSGVAGVLATVTVVDPQGAGHLTVWPSGTAMPGTSNLNFQAGQTIAAAVIVPVSADFALRLSNASSGSVQVIVDVSGYILSGTPTAAGTIGPVTARIADSRLGLQIPGAVSAFGTTAVQVAAPGSGVAGAVATLTVVDPQAAGHIRVWRSGTSMPGTSNVNFQAGQAIATTMVVPIGSDGRIEVFNGSPGTVQVIVDITGYTLTGVHVSGAVWAWGGNEEGQLGNGSSADSRPPVPVFGLSDVVSVAGGGVAGYALRRDGTVWSWGYGAFGQRGTGACCAMVSPVPLQIPGLSNITAIAASGGTGYALRRDGTVWSWGDGHDGTLGDGDDESYSTVPVQVSDGEMTRATAIAAGTRAAYALDADGQLWAWGEGFNGALGNNSTLTSSVPVRVSGLSDVTVAAVAGGLGTGYAVGSDGSGWAWGWGQFGQLGNNGTTDSLLPVRVSGLNTVTAVAANAGSAYALDAGGAAWAWGDGEYGQLGNGGTAGSMVPTPVYSVSGQPKITAIAAGGATGYALRSDGTAVAWGLGDRGQVGPEGTPGSYAPVPVTGLTKITAIAAGNHTGYAVTQ